MMRRAGVALLLMLIALGLISLRGATSRAGSCRAKPRCRALTVSSYPNPSTAGERVEVSGTLTGYAAGTRVVLWQRLPRADNFKPIAHTTTDGSGGYTVALAPLANRHWYITAG